MSNNQPDHARIPRLLGAGMRGANKERVQEENDISAPMSGRATCDTYGRSIYRKAMLPAFTQSPLGLRVKHLSAGACYFRKPRKYLISMTYRRPGTRRLSFRQRRQPPSQQPHNTPLSTEPSQTNNETSDETSGPSASSSVGPTAPFDGAIAKPPLSGSSTRVADTVAFFGLGKTRKLQPPVPFSLPRTGNDNSVLKTRSLMSGSDAIGQESTLPVTLPFVGTCNVHGRLILLTVPLLWASYSIILKWLYRLPWAINPALFNVLRLALGSLFVLPELTPGTATMPVLLAGAELGLWTILTNILQFVGLRYTTASRAAFLSQLATVLVPLTAVAIGQEKSLAWNVAAAAPLSVLGVALLTLDGAAASPLGDGIMLVVACVAAMYVLRSKHHSRLPTRALVAAKTVFQTIFACLYFFVTSAQSPSTILAGATPVWLAVNVALVIWAGFFIGFVSTALQMRGQALVTASEAAVIFTSNPLWAALLAIPLGERFGPKGFAGAAVILAATGLASGVGVQRGALKEARKAA